ncbi:MAG TPA: hypothetical protein VH088_01560 [Terriglobales bacterium]|jgi:hypothetical protein|nr:hypothetical protein [Terriglobales bacterium]
MLHKCANSTCSNLFRRLHEGKLFQVETEYRAVASWRRNHPVRKVERYWLCDECAPQMTLSFEKGGVMTVPLTRERQNAMKLPMESVRVALPAHAAGR